MNNDIEEVLYSRQVIQKRCQQLGRQLTRDYRGKNPLVIGVLKGAIVFMTDLIRDMDIYMQLDFIDVSSYGGGTQSTGRVKLVKDVDSAVRGRNVLFVEDIVDTGRTLKFLRDLIRKRGAKSVRMCTLLNKPQRRIVDVHPHYFGFQIPNKFVVGYGMDYQGEYRNLPYVGVLKPRVYQH